MNIRGLFILSCVVLLPFHAVETSPSFLYVSNDGLDVPKCLQGVSYCRSLQYLLHNVQEAVSWSVVIESSQSFNHSTSINVTNLDLYNSTLSLIGGGIELVNINFTGLKRLWNFRELTFENLVLIGIPQIEHGVSVLFKDCFIQGNTFTEIQFSNMHNISFMHCEIQYILDYSHGLYTIMKFKEIKSHIFISCIFKNHGYSPFFAFLDSTRPALPQEKLPLVIFDDCLFTAISEFLIQYYYGYVGYWIVIIGNYQLFLNKCDMSNFSIIDTVSKNLISGGDEIKLVITNSLFSYNMLTSSETSALIALEFAISVEFTNVTFDSNVGAGILFGNGNLSVSHVTFINNTGFHTGGIAFTNALFTMYATFDSLFFRDNTFTEEYGGVIYFQTGTCVLYLNQSNLHFYDQTQFIFFSFHKCIERQFKGLSTNHLRTVPYQIETTQPTLSIFPGQPILIQSLNITDYFGHESHCTAISSLECYHDSCQINNITTVKLNGKKLLFIQSSDQIETPIYLSSKSEPSPLQPSWPLLNLKINCVTVKSNFNVTLRACPLGYVFNGTSGICDKAAYDNDNNNNIVYDELIGVVCIRHNYWYGGMKINMTNTVNITALCSLPYCAIHSPCPINGYTSTHYKLPWTQDEQCSGLYGGVLCKSCRNDSVFSFGASRCLPLSGCIEDKWQPYFILLTAIGGQIILSLLMICLKPVTKFGVGYLNGPLFFLAIYRLLPISHSFAQTTSPLTIIFSLYQTILLLDLDILGKIPWCFFKDADHTLNYSFRFLGPLVTFSVLLVIAIIARFDTCSRRLNRLFRSPIQPMCLLMVLSFWSLSNTSIEIIKPIIISGEWRFAIQPQFKYMGNAYIIVLWCVSVILLVFVYIPFILLLFFTSYLRTRFNLYRIEPFLDAFHSSYRRKCEWYSGVYFLSWLILNINMPLYLFITLSGGVAVLHFITQSYKKSFLNICDTLLLIDLMILASLSFQCVNDICPTPIAIMNYPLLLLPLLYMLLGGVWLVFGDVLKKVKAKIGQRWFDQRSNETLQDLVAQDVIGTDVGVALDRENRNVHSTIKSSQEVAILEREPLIYDDN